MIAKVLIHLGKIPPSHKKGLTCPFIPMDFPTLYQRSKSRQPEQKSFVSVIKWTPAPAPPSWAMYKLRKSDRSSKVQIAHVT